ncbi:MAG: prepilin-type N-terminal cleavage/methylation domain-containing protein [Gemmatimonadaceae bacterium]|nr:prepilin-type N-terminal cleavage/methylation domain-containing protein [Gemmatimonadaceae bacterium]
MKQMSPNGVNGFSIVEIVVAIAIMAVLGAIVVPSVGSYLDRKRVEDSAATLDSLRVAIGRFRTATADYPGRLSHLTKRITTSDRTACNTAANTIVNYVAGSQTGWDNNGPFWDRSIPRTGIPLSIGTVLDSMHRTSTSVLPGAMVMTIPGVFIGEARELNLLEDGPLDANQADGSNTTGTVQFTSSTSSTVTYFIPVANSC